MHGIGNLAAQIGPYGLAVDCSRAKSASRSRPNKA